MILVLDCDGVVQTGPCGGGRWDKNLKRDLGLDTELLQEKFFRRFWRDLLSGRGELENALEKVWPELSCAASPQEFIRYWFEQDCTLDRHVLERTDALRGAGSPVFLATNQEHRRAKYLWEERSLCNHFDGLIYSAELGNQKPEFSFFELATLRLPAQDPGDVLFLDDSIAHVEAARAAGWRAHLYRDVGDLDRSIAEFSQR